MIAPAKSFNPWPYGIVATFVLFIAATVALIVLMCRNPMDLVSADYYEQEIRYQRRLDEMNRVSALGAGVTVSFDAESRELRVQLPAPHTASRGRLHLYRPSAAGLDREYELAPDSTGKQVFAARDLAAGSWKARLRWTASGQDYFTEQALLIPADNRTEAP